MIDTGIGIKEEDKDKLFKLFGYVQDSQGMNVHGIGLGLTISKKIVDQFEGDVCFESTEGEGSIFMFKLKIFNEIKNDREQQGKSVEDERGGVNFNMNSEELKKA